MGGKNIFLNTTLIIFSFKKNEISAVSNKLCKNMVNNNKKKPLFLEKTPFPFTTCYRYFCLSSSVCLAKTLITLLYIINYSLKIHTQFLRKVLFLTIIRRDILLQWVTKFNSFLQDQN